MDSFVIPFSFTWIVLERKNVLAFLSFFLGGGGGGGGGGNDDATFVDSVFESVMKFGQVNPQTFCDFCKLFFGNCMTSVMD